MTSEVKGSRFEMLWRCFLPVKDRTIPMPAKENNNGNEIFR